MDAKITLSFNEAVIKEAKKFAEKHNISLSRLTEMLYQRIISGGYQNLEDLPVSTWVSEVAEGPAEYKTKPRSRKASKDTFFKSKK